MLSALFVNAQNRGDGPNNSLTNRRFVRQGDKAKKPLGDGTPAYGGRQRTLVQHERSVWME
jgi:hypothetical protein